MYEGYGERMFEKVGLSMVMCEFGVLKERIGA